MVQKQVSEVEKWESSTKVNKLIENNQKIQQSEKVLDFYK